jgi:hypothetical protein
LIFLGHAVSECEGLLVDGALIRLKDEFPLTFWIIVQENESLKPMSKLFVVSPIIEEMNPTKKRRVLLA